jgi:hypothetical protein
MAETEDLKSFQCRFESDWGHRLLAEGKDSRDAEVTSNCSFVAYMLFRHP